MSKHPIVGMETHMFRLTGTPIFVHQGDWIAGKGCGCVTIMHPQLGEVDVWDTHVCGRTDTYSSRPWVDRWAQKSSAQNGHLRHMN